MGFTVNGDDWEVVEEWPLAAGYHVVRRVKDGALSVRQTKLLPLQQVTTEGQQPGDDGEVSRTPPPCT